MCVFGLLISLTACAREDVATVTETPPNPPLLSAMPTPTLTPAPTPAPTPTPTPTPNYNFFMDGKGFEFDFLNVMGWDYINARDLSHAMDETGYTFPFPTDELSALLIGDEKYHRLCEAGHVITVVQINETSLFDSDGQILDNWIISLNGVRQMLPLDAVFRNGRMYFDAYYFALSLNLPAFGQADENEEHHLFELTEEHGLFAYFNRSRSRSRLELFTGYERPERLPAPDGERSAFMRFEDVIAHGHIHHTHDMLKRRVMADFLYSHSAAFTLAWVPVHVRPLEEFRNDPRDYNRYNVEFVYTMDYQLSRGGQLGLHGYTHQRGNQNSVAGYDFGPNVNERETRENFGNQLAAAAHFGWTPYSFTFAKYYGTQRQYEIAGEYFDFIMPNFNTRGSNNPRRVEVDGRQVVYMNTAEDHMVDRGERHLNDLLARLNRAGGIASFFFHTWLDYEFIEVSRDENNLLTIQYDARSPLHQILDNLRRNGRTLRPTTDF